MDWINYDRLALAAASAAGGAADDFTGERLRSNWMRYDGVTHLRATLSRELRGNLSLDLHGENLLNRQLGEPDNATVLPGRTVTLGIRASF